MNIFHLQPNDIQKLTPERAVEIFRSLLWAEATRIGIGRHLIHVPSCINVGDGGLDAVVNNVKPKFDDVIPTGFSGYQIKSSDLSPKECKKELHKKKNLNDNLKPEIKRLLENIGTYILVLFKSLTEEKRIKRKDEIIKDLSKNGYPEVKTRTI
ncbi:MAG: hypothetical protein HWN66_17270 [Candidatus Helarchaeota archaeon]|nr:hypothetical protein [Candidatus Helarchaeota archaeon]